MAIRSLTQFLELDEADQFPFNSETAGGDVRVPLSVLAEFIQSLLVVPTELETQYASPGATGFSVTVAPTEEGGNVWLLLTPGGNYAAGTINLPDGTDRQEVLCNCTTSVTTLTVACPGGAGVTGAPSTLAVNGFFRMRFDAVNNRWYRVG